MKTGIDFEQFGLKLGMFCLGKNFCHFGLKRGKFYLRVRSEIGRKIAYFGLKRSRFKELKKRAAHPHHKFPGVPGGGGGAFIKDRD